MQAAFGKDAVLKLPKEHVLAFALTRENSLTRSKATHLRTFYFGLRWNYADAYLSWHSNFPSNVDKLGLDSSGARRFPIPVGNDPGAKSGLAYDLVLMSDFALDDNYLSTAQLPRERRSTPTTRRGFPLAPV